MGFVALPGVIATAVTAYYFRETGVSTPFSDKPVNLWQIVVRDEAQPFGVLAQENFVLWLVLYSVAWILLYVEPQRSLLRPFKLNPHFPAASLMLTEFMRSARGVLIGRAYFPLHVGLRQGSL